VSESPIDQLLHAIDNLDADAAVAMLAPDAELLVVDGRRARGTDGVRRLFHDFLSNLRSTSHRVTSQWQVDDAWVAEVEADYELNDYLVIKGLPRAFVLRGGPDGLRDVHVYGAHERPLQEHRTGDEGIWVGGRWVPPL
jgi:SnoaL-like domain